MTRFRFAVLVLIGAAFLAAPLSALCSSCCAPESGADAMSAPMPCCGDSCGPSFTAARPHDPALTSSRTKLDPPPPALFLEAQAIQLPVATGSLASALPAAPAESPPVSSSVLRL